MLLDVLVPHRRNRVHRRQRQAQSIVEHGVVLRHLVDYVDECGLGNGFQNGLQRQALRHVVGVPGRCKDDGQRVLAPVALEWARAVGLGGLRPSHPDAHPVGLIGAPLDIGDQFVCFTQDAANASSGDVALGSFKNRSRRLFKNPSEGGIVARHGVRASAAAPCHFLWRVLTPSVKR